MFGLIPPRLDCGCGDSGVVPTGPVEHVPGLGKGGHVRGFVPWDGGSLNWVETHGNVSRLRKIFDDSGSSIILSRTGFPT